MEHGEYDFHIRNGGTNWWHVGMRACTIAAIHNYVSPCTGVDLGCGPGYFVRDINRIGFDFHGIDMSADAISSGNLPGETPRLMEGDLVEFLSQPGEQFGLLSLLDVLPHSAVDQDRTLKLARDRLLEDGYLLLRVPAFRMLYGKHDRFVHQTRRYRVQDIELLARKHGFHIVRKTYANFLLFIPITITILALKMLAKWKFSSEESSTNNVNPPRLFNRLLHLVLAAEAKIIGHGIDLPFGVTLIVLLKKNG